MDESVTIQSLWTVISNNKNQGSRTFPAALADGCCCVYYTGIR